MSDRVQTVLKWLQGAAQLIGLLIALLGGGQHIASQMAPGAFGGYEEPAANNMLAGVLLTVLTPAVGWVVRTVYAKTRGKQLTPVADLVAGETSITTLETQLADDAAAMAACKVLRKSLSDKFQNAGKTAPAVEAK